MDYGFSLYWVIISLYALTTLVAQTIPRFSKYRDNRRFMRRLYLVHTVPWILIFLWGYIEEKVTRSELQAYGELMLYLLTCFTAGYIGVRLTQRIVGMGR